MDSHYVYVHVCGFKSFSTMQLLQNCIVGLHNYCNWFLISNVKLFLLYI